MNKHTTHFLPAHFRFDQVTGLSLLFFLLLGIFVPGFLHAQSSQPFLLFYSNNVQGEIEPCG